tara:strand:- start:671 stop:1681 length:1011 start_codon:yes stop_codon:yes gene_type:complete
MNRFIKCLIKKESSFKPVWFMRQAGRYLPEFNKIRSQNKNFIKLCLNSELSSEITLQPIKRFDLDAAIIFSDILIIPHALGQEVNFVKGEGPILEKLNVKNVLNIKDQEFLKKLRPVYDAIAITRKKLRKDKALISFVGAPWTLLAYMLNLKTNENKLNLESFKKSQNNIEELINKLIHVINLHIRSQKEAGADAVQIFDSWAGLLKNDNLKKFCYMPNSKIVNYSRHINLPSICFPKGIGINYKNFIDIVLPDGISIDYDLDPIWAKNNLKNVCIQGGMSPKILLRNEDDVMKEVEKYLDIFKNNAYIFNLGHGILPNTDPDMIKKVVEKVINYK